MTQHLYVLLKWFIKFQRNKKCGQTTFTAGYFPVHVFGKRKKLAQRFGHALNELSVRHSYKQQLKKQRFTPYLRNIKSKLICSTAGLLSVSPVKICINKRSWQRIILCSSYRDLFLKLQYFPWAVFPSTPFIKHLFNRCYCQSIAIQSSLFCPWKYHTVFIYNFVLVHVFAILQFWYNNYAYHKILI